MNHHLMQTNFSLDFVKPSLHTRVTKIMFINISGTSSPTGRFFGACAVLASHEDSKTWAAIYKFVHDYNNIVPSFQLGDGAKAITKAGNEVFAGHPFTRLMCWSHVYSENLLNFLRRNILMRKMLL